MRGVTGGPALVTLVLVLLVLLTLEELDRGKEGDFLVIFLVCKFSVDQLVCDGRDDAFDFAGTCK